MRESITDLVTARPISRGPPLGAQAGIAGDDGDHETKNFGLDDAVEDVLGGNVLLEGTEELGT